MLGLERESVRVVPYSPEWPRLFEEERGLLESAFGGRALAFEHVGSTSVPGLAAKPVLDLMASVRDLKDVEPCVAPLARVGYTYKGENGLPGRHYFTKGSPLRTHHLHVVTHGGDFWREHLLFRDHLRAHPDEARAYARLKTELSRKFSRDRAAYTEAKAPFIRRVVELAKAETNQFPRR